MSNILKANKGGKVKQYTNASIKRINLADNNSITNDMLQNQSVDGDKLSSDISNLVTNGSFDSFIQKAIANTSLTDNANTNPRGLKLSELQYQAGVCRIEIYRIGLAEGEFDANGLPAWKIVEGTQPQLWNQIRFYGYGWANILNDHGGVYPSTNISGEYALITGIFDALSLVAFGVASGANNIDVLIDNIDSGANISIRAASVLGGYNIRSMVSVSDNTMKGLALGLHTIKLVNGATDSNYIFMPMGFDFISSTKQEQAGTAYINGAPTTDIQQTVANPTLTGTKGGIAYRYLDTATKSRLWATREPAAYTAKVASPSSGNTTVNLTSGSTSDMLANHIVLLWDSLGKSELVKVLTVPTGTSFTCAALANSYTSANIELWGKADTTCDHTNEVVTAERAPRQFGAGHANDFQLLAPTTSYTNKVFTLDDGVTTFHESNGAFLTYGVNSAEGFSIALSSEASYVFNGTGLDLLLGTINVGVFPRVLDIYVDGVLAKQISWSAAQSLWVKVASDLPNQTHIVRLVNTSGTLASPAIQLFREYGLAKPTAVASLDDSLLLAVKNMAPSYVKAYTDTVNFISKGVTHLAPNRGWFCTGTGWALTVSSSSNTTRSKNYLLTAVSGDAGKIWFYGTGFEFHTLAGSGFSSSIQLTLDGTITNFSGYTVQQTSGGTKFTASSGIFNATNATTIYYAISVSGLTEGWHSLSVTNGAAASCYISGLGVIGNSYSISQVTGGAQSISTTLDGSYKDLRKFRDNLLPERVNYVEANANTSAPTCNVGTQIPLPDMLAVIKTKGNPIEICFAGCFYNNTVNNSCYVGIYLDGVLLESTRTNTSAVANADSTIGWSRIIAVAAGVHTIQVMWNISGSTIGTSRGTNRNLTVKELGD
jgi:hypothetical protein